MSENHNSMSENPQEQQTPQQPASPPKSIFDIFGYFKGGNIDPMYPIYEDIYTKYRITLENPDEKFTDDINAIINAHTIFDNATNDPTTSQEVKDEAKSVLDKAIKDYEEKLNKYKESLPLTSGGKRRNKKNRKTNRKSKRRNKKNRKTARK